MTDSTALVVVYSGDAYKRYAEALFESAREFFKPTPRVGFVLLKGREGWPAATMYRPRVCLDNWHLLKSYDHLYLIDADMMIENPVGSEIVSTGGDGVVATLHPGYVGKAAAELPHERRTESCCYLWPSDGDVYYAGGFWGGTREGFRWLATRIAEKVDEDMSSGIVPVYHDESALNSVLALCPPSVTLSPAYCHPDADHYYREHVWREPYERIIVALDKPAEVRGER